MPFLMSNCPSYETSQLSYQTGDLPMPGFEFGEFDFTPPASVSDLFENSVSTFYNNGILNDFQPTEASSLYVAPSEQLHKQTTTSSSKSKRERTKFTKSQILELEEEFKNAIYLNKSRRIGIAQRLSLCQKQVQHWFQNRRMKQKRAKRGQREQATQLNSVNEHQGIVQRLMSYSPGQNTNNQASAFCDSTPNIELENIQKNFEALAGAWYKSQSTALINNDEYLPEPIVSSHPWWREPLPSFPNLDFEQFDSPFSSFGSYQ